MATIPQVVLNALDKLEASDKAVVTSYINDLQESINGGSSAPRDIPEADPMAEDDNANAEAPFPPLYESGEDFDKAGDLKMEAADLVSGGDYEGALEKYNAAVLSAPPSALLYANRATTLLKLDRPRAAERDCNEALQENPDSAKALRVRGKARKALGQWEGALHDLSASQQIDFDEGTVEDLKTLTEMRIDHEKSEAASRIQEEDRLRKKAADIKKSQADAKREAAEDASPFAPGGMGGMPGGMGGMPGGMGGMPGGMGGMPGGMPSGMEGMMGAFMSDPEIRAGMEKPKVQAAFQELMSGPGGPMGLLANPAKLQEMMSDPEVGPVLQKLMAKIGGGMGGMGGAMPGAHGAEDDDGIPNLDEMDDGVDMDDLPDLE